jgi:hypothetical protein
MTEQATDHVLQALHGRLDPHALANPEVLGQVAAR